MSKFENTEAMELNLEEMDKVVGGNKKPLVPMEGFIVYRIEQNDTLGRIAANHHCTVAQILNWNPKIRDKGNISVGDYIYIRES